MKILTLIIFLGLLSCKYQKIYAQAKQLTDSANAIFKNTLDPLKALPLLNKATELDSTYLPALVTKLNFEMVSNMPDKAILTAMTLIRIKPGVSEYYSSIGFIYEKMKDTISSKKYFMHAVGCYNKKLEGMSNTNKNYDWILFNKATNMILAGDEQSANYILKELYNRTQEVSFKETVKSVMNKSRQQILEDMK